MTKIPQAKQPSQANLLSIFIATLHLEVRFHLKRSKVCDFKITKKEVVRIEDDLFLSSWFQQNDITKVSGLDLKLKGELIGDEFKSSVDGCYETGKEKLYSREPLVEGTLLDDDMTISGVKYDKPLQEGIFLYEQ